MVLNFTKIDFINQIWNLMQTQYPFRPEILFHIDFLPHSQMFEIKIRIFVVLLL